jgi:hypothetical protein
LELEKKNLGVPLLSGGAKGLQEKGCGHSLKLLRLETNILPWERERGCFSCF